MCIAPVSVNCLSAETLRGRGEKREKRKEQRAKSKEKKAKRGEQKEEGFEEREGQRQGGQYLDTTAQKGPLHF